MCCYAELDLVALNLWKVWLDFKKNDLIKVSDEEIMILFGVLW